jgi:hypothetical protein
MQERIIKLTDNNNYYKDNKKVKGMELVAFLGKDKENWGQISALLKRAPWDKAVLVKNKDAEKFPALLGCQIVEVNSEKQLLELKDEIIQKLKPILKGDFEVALSLASGSGKEHMALISALLNLPVGVRIAVFTQKGVEFLT